MMKRPQNNGHSEGLFGINRELSRHFHFSNLFQTAGTQGPDRSSLGCKMSEFENQYGRFREEYLNTMSYVV